MNRQRRMLLQAIAAAVIGTTLTACGAPVGIADPAPSPSTQPRASASPVAAAPTMTPPTGNVPAASAAPTPTVVDAQPQTPILSFNPQSGGPGTVVQVSGSGYVPNAPVKVRLGIPHPVGEVLVSAPADANGRWQASFTMPDRLPSGEPVPSANLRLVAMNDANEALASAPFAYVPPASADDPPPAVTLEGAPQAVRNLLNAYIERRDARPYLASNLRAEIDGHAPLELVLHLRHDTLRSFTVHAPDLSRPSEVLFVPATLSYESGDVEQMFTLVVENGEWVINGSSPQ